MYQHHDTIGQIDGGECGQLVAVTWPGAVDTFKARVGTYVENADAGVKACPSFPADERAAWDRFLAVWRPFAARETSTFGSYNEWLATCEYSRQMDKWLEKIEKHCKVPGPKPPTAPDTANLVKWLAVGAVALAAGVTVAAIAPQIKALIPRRKVTP